jgi:putative ABC transport system permease protein
MRRYAAVRMLLHERSTTAGAILGVVAIVFLVGQQLAIMFGLFTLMSAVVDNSGADIWVVSKNVENTASVSNLPSRYVDRLAGLPEIEWAEPVIYSGAQLRLPNGTFQPVQVIGVTRPELHGGPWRFTAGGNDVLLEYDGATVDKFDLQDLGSPGIGDIVEVNAHRIRVAGYTEGSRAFGAPLLFTNATKAREVTGLPVDRCSDILVKLKPGASIGQALADIEALLPKASALTSQELARNTIIYNLTSTGIGSSFGLSTLVGLLVGVVIITLTMYTNVLNRQRDFAVLRALGARRRDVFAIIVYQALTIGFVGLLIGFFLLAGFLFGVKGSRLPANLPVWLPPAHALLTFLLCFAGSALALRRALKIEPASAFR